MSRDCWKFSIDIYFGEAYYIVSGNRIVIARGARKG
jgi:hypothetical protein